MDIISRSTLKTVIASLLALVALCLSGGVMAQVDEARPTSGVRLETTLETLKAIVNTERHIRERLNEIASKMDQTSSDSALQELRQQDLQLRQELAATRKSFDEIATEYDIADLKGEGKDAFDLKSEVMFLLEPALKEMKRMTSGVRNKTALREKLDSYNERLPIAQSAIDNLQALLAASSDEAVNASLTNRLGQWQLQQTILENDRQSIQLQLDKLEAREVSFSDASQAYLKQFVQKRGLYLLIAFAVVVAVVMLSKLSAAAMRKILPGFRAKHRSFRIRLIQLLHGMVSFFLAVLGPMIVFYIVEDWVLFSLGLLILVAAVWTIRSAVPRYWYQMQLFLNIGSVREGERLEFDGIPWRVEQINLFSQLVNPTAGMQLRLPIDRLVGLSSRPVRQHEPWFPCKQGDWVILADGSRGKVTGISKEMIQLVERGGALRTYPMSEFLTLAPHNLSTSFRLKEIIGVSYGLQKLAPRVIPDALEKFIQQRIEQEGLADKVLNLRIEFSAAGESSLDITVIIDFTGEISELYGRLRRTMQRWCVEACNAYDWEIPFPQLTVHQAVRAA